MIGSNKGSTPSPDGGSKEQAPLPTTTTGEDSDVEMVGAVESPKPDRRTLQQQSDAAAKAILDYRMQRLEAVIRNVPEDGESGWRQQYWLGFEFELVRMH